MGRYTVGPCTLTLTGHDGACKEGDTVDHDFSINGPDGEHGPARETALIAAGALTPITEEASGDRVSGRRRTATTETQEA